MSPRRNPSSSRRRCECVVPDRGCTRRRSRTLSHPTERAGAAGEVCANEHRNYRGGTQETPGRRVRRRRGGSTRRLHARSAETPSCRALGRRPIPQRSRQTLAHRARRSDQRPATKTDDPLDRESQSVDMPTKHAHTVHAHFSKVCGVHARASCETVVRVVTSVWCSVSAVSLSEPPRERPHTAPARATGQRGVRGDTHV